MTEHRRYSELREINVNSNIEKKNGLSYLSWAWAVDHLLGLDPGASWEYAPMMDCGNDTKMVFCTVNAFGKSRTAQLPVMNYKNQAISNPDAFAINTAMQRCLAKAVSLHGIGLYIYAGEDLPNGEDAPAVKKPGKISPVDKTGNRAVDDAVAKAISHITDCVDEESVLKVGRYQWKYCKDAGATDEQLDLIQAQTENKTTELRNKNGGL